MTGPSVDPDDFHAALAKATAALGDEQELEDEITDADINPCDFDPEFVINASLPGSVFFAARDERPGFREAIAAVRAIVRPEDFRRPTSGSLAAWALDAFDAGAIITPDQLLDVWSVTGVPSWPLDRPCERVLEAARAVRSLSIERQLLLVADELHRVTAPARRSVLVQRAASLSAELLALDAPEMGAAA